MTIGNGAKEWAIEIQDDDCDALVFHDEVCVLEPAKCADKDILDTDDVSGSAGRLAQLTNSAQVQEAHAKEADIGSPPNLAAASVEGQAADGKQTACQNVNDSCGGDCYPGGILRFKGVRRLLDADEVDETMRNFVVTRNLDDNVIEPVVQVEREPEDEEAEGGEKLQEQGKAAEGEVEGLDGDDGTPLTNKQQQVVVVEEEEAEEEEAEEEEEEEEEEEVVEQEKARQQSSGWDVEVEVEERMVAEKEPGPQEQQQEEEEEEESEREQPGSEMQQDSEGISSDECGSYSSALGSVECGRGRRDAGEWQELMQMQEADCRRAALRKRRRRCWSSSEDEPPMAAPRMRPGSVRQQPAEHVRRVPAGEQSSLRALMTWPNMIRLGGAVLLYTAAYTVAYTIFLASLAS